MTINRQVVLKARPNGVPKPTDFEVVEATVLAPGPGQILIRNRYFGLEPAIRGWLDGTENYFKPLNLGDPIRCPSIGEVIESHHPEYKAGGFVRGLTAWEDYSILSNDTILLQPVYPKPDIPLAHYAGVFGGSGQTAYVGLHEIGKIDAGQTVVISAAAGAVGSVAGQIAKLRGCTTVGIVGSADKAAVLKDRLGYDIAIDYRATPDIKAEVKKACPQGVDIYFDNVGGSTLDAMLPNMKDFGRIVCCGMIGDYNNQDNPSAVYNLWQMVVHQITMRGFLLFSYPEQALEAVEEIENWIRTGKLLVLENITRGIAGAPDAFSKLMGGKTIGKTLVELEY